MCLGVPGKIEEIMGTDPLERVARVNFGGVFRQVSLACVPEAQVGDYVIVHVGLAISILNEEDAKATLEMLESLDEGTAYKREVSIGGSDRGGA